MKPRALQGMVSVQRTDLRVVERDQLIRRDVRATVGARNGGWVCHGWSLYERDSGEHEEHDYREND